MFALLNRAVRSPATVAVDREDGYPVLRLRHAQATELRLVSGTAELVIDGARRGLVAGEEAVVPARTAYRLVSSDGARVAQRYRPER